MEYVYLYVWEDGKFYIGRTFENSGRYNNPVKYKDQYVGKYMTYKPYKPYILYQSENAALIYWLEAKLINHFYNSIDNLNAKNEDDTKSVGCAASKYDDIYLFANSMIDIWDWESTLDYIIFDVEEHINDH